MSRPSLICTAPGPQGHRTYFTPFGMGGRGLHLCTWPPSLSILTCEVAPVAMLTLGPWALWAVPAGLAMELFKAALWCLGFRGPRVRGAEGGMEAGLTNASACIRARTGSSPPVGTSDVLAPMA